MQTTSTEFHNEYDPIEPILIEPLSIPQILNAIISILLSGKKLFFVEAWKVKKEIILNQAKIISEPVWNMGVCFEIRVRLQTDHSFLIQHVTNYTYVLSPAILLPIGI